MWIALPAVPWLAHLVSNTSPLLPASRARKSQLLDPRMGSSGFRCLQLIHGVILMYLLLKTLGVPSWAQMGCRAPVGDNPQDVSTRCICSLVRGPYLSYCSLSFQVDVFSCFEFLLRPLAATWLTSIPRQCSQPAPRPWAWRRWQQNSKHSDGLP